ncbi:MAG TPA: MgtC/SapB family protein [Sphingomonadales bacterium]
MRIPVDHIVVNIGVAVLLGLIIGFERGWRMRGAEQGTRFAGIRTFILISFLGALTAALEGNGYRELGVVIAVALAATLFAVANRPRSDSDQGITTIIAALLTYILGFMAGIGLLELAAISAVAIAIVLGFKREMHGWFQVIEQRDLYAALKLLAVSVLVLPLLPNENMGPLDAINPYQIWWMVVLIAVISFAGHFAIKWTRPDRGLMVTALAGGLASSTAIAVSFSRMARRMPELSRLLGAGQVASSVVSMPRTYVIAVAVAPALADRLLLPLGAAMVGGGIAAWLMWRGQRPEHLNVAEVGTEFELTTAFRFGVLLAAIMLAVAALRKFVGDQALYAMATIGGLVDLTAMTLTAAEAANRGLSLSVAVETILIAIAVNTVAKLAFTLYLGNRTITFWAFVGSAVMVLAGAAGYFALPLLNALS